MNNLKWISFGVVGSLFAVSHIGMIGMVANRKGDKLPDLDIPVGPYTSYSVVATKNGYTLRYKANDPKVLTRLKNLEEPKGLFGNKKTELHLRETYTMEGEGSKKDVEGTVMTDKDIACIKVEGSGNSTGKLVGASVGVKAAPAFSNIPIVGWLAAGFVTMFAQDKGSEIGGQIARDYNDC